MQKQGILKKCMQIILERTDNICLVNGSFEGILYSIQIFISERGEIVGIVPSYFMFQVYSEMYNRKFVKGKV